MHRGGDNLTEAAMPPAYFDASPLRPTPSDPRPTPEQVARCLAAYCATSPHYAYAALIEIGHAYAEACATVNLDVWLTLGQVMHETGKLTSWWCARPRRNPAGIGVNGQSRKTPHPTEAAIWPFNPATKRYHRGFSYPAWVPYAVEAHVARLLWYAHPGPFSPAEQALYDRGTADRGMPAAARGSALTPRELGWAHNRRRAAMMGWAFPGWTYGRGLAAHANALRALL